MDSNHLPLSIYSFNCRGIRNRDKRLNIFNWLKRKDLGITLLQETHSSKIDEEKWEREWGGTIYFSHGEFNSRGVAILIPKDLEHMKFEFIEGIQDKEGRFILIKCKVEENILVIVNLYCPTKDNINEQIKFIENIREKIEEYSDKDIILAGDLNTYLNIELDKKGGKIEKSSKYAKMIESLCDEYSLVDIWRIRNPNKLEFTRRERTKMGIVHSRLDYFLISTSLSYQVKLSKITPGLCSDHSLVMLQINLPNTQKRGKGFWKFNNDLLTDQTYIEKVKSIINHIKTNVSMNDKNALWEYMKCQIRTDTIIYSGEKAKNLKKKENELIKKLEVLEKNMSNNDLDYVEYQQIKSEWENIQRIKTNGIIIRSKAKWVEEGEKNTKYFLNLEKRNFNSTYIKTLIDKQGKTLTNAQEIIGEQKNFYENLYTTKQSNDFNSEIQDIFLKSRNIPKLNNTDKDMCDEVLSVSECGSALKLLPNNKSPGSDGFTTNFFKFFWIDIKETLFQSYVYSFEHNKLTDFQTRGILNLIPKENKDLRYLKNWRPVSLLNTDYKILTKVLALRLQKVIKSIVNSDQVGYIKGRYIGENIRTIFDILSYADLNQIESYIIQVDFEKAFDSIEWNFLFETLKAFNFGENFIKWIQLLYTDIYSCVGNNGYYSNFFKLSRSIRQGCPISALLFLLVAEVIAINIREDKNIHGIKIEDFELKINLMADDTTLFIADIQSLIYSIKKFQDFEKCSGLKINTNKTEVIPIGKIRNKDVQLTGALSEMKVRKGPFKALGIWFSEDEKEITKLNFGERIRKVEILINIWKQRHLSLKGKVIIIKTLLLPQIQFLFSLLYVSDEILNKIDTLLYDFLWDSKPAKVKRSTIIANIEDGGLKMVDTYAVHASAKIGWIKRLFNNHNGKWKFLFINMLNLSQDIINKNFHIELFKNGRTDYHKQIIKEWVSFHALEPQITEDILGQFLFYNHFIRIDNKVITEKFINQDYKNLNVRLVNIIDREGNIMSVDQMSEIFQGNINVWKYNSIKTAIPLKWKKQIKENIGSYNLENIYVGVEPTVRINSKLKLISKIENKEIYSALIGKKTKQPTSIETWIDSYPFLESMDWKKIFALPVRIIQEPYFQSFQYKILNRILNCNEKLHKWGIRESNICNYCKEIDTVEHHLYHCAYSKQIWEQLENWFHLNLEVSWHFAVCEIIFGIPIQGDIDINIINFIIILTKWFINKAKSDNQPLHFLNLLHLVRDKITTIVYINSKNDVVNKDWHEKLIHLL